MIAFKLAEEVQEVVWACMGYVRMGAESCFDLHGVHLNRRRELFGPS